MARRYGDRLQWVDLCGGYSSRRVVTTVARRLQAFRPDGTLDTSFLWSWLGAGSGHVEFEIVPGNSCFTPGGSHYWHLQWSTQAWSDHFSLQRFGQAVLMQPDRIVVGATTQVQKSDPRLDVALDFGLIAHRL